MSRPICTPTLGFFSSFDKSVIKIIKRAGDKLSSCRTPDIVLKELVGNILSSFTLDDGKEYSYNTYNKIHI